MSNETFIGFWYSSERPSPRSPAMGDIPGFVNVVPIAFTNLFPGNTVCDGYLQKSNPGIVVQQGIKAAQANGLKVTLSIIGTPNPPVSWNAISDPQAFASFVAAKVQDWSLDGIDIDFEPPAPNQIFIDTVKALRQALGPDAIITYEAYLPYIDTAALGKVSDDISWINTMAYKPYPGYSATINIFEQYARVLGPEKVAIGVACVIPGTNTGTPFSDVPKLCQYEPANGTKKGVMLWDISSDIQSITGQPDWTWTNTIHGYLP